MDAHHNDHETTKVRHGSAHGRAAAGPGDDATLSRIGEALRGLRYGSVLTIVQDGVVVQIERTEKTRFSR
jgi:hypothetical protein